MTRINFPNTILITGITMLVTSIYFLFDVFLSLHLIANILGLITIGYIYYKFLKLSRKVSKKKIILSSIALAILYFLYFHLRMAFPPSKGGGYLSMSGLAYGIALMIGAYVLFIFNLISIIIIHIALMLKINRQHKNQ